MAMRTRGEVSTPVVSNPVAAADIDALIEEKAAQEASFKDADLRAALAEQEAMLAKIIEQKVNEALLAARMNQGNPVVNAETRTPAAVTPQKFLKHYRCDVSPDMQIQVRGYDRDADKLGAPIKGHWIKFRRGHFFATTQEQVDQLEWMIRHPLFDPAEPGQVIGGNPSIYEDDGQQVTKCQFCDEVFVMGSNSYKAHLRASHGLDS